MPLNDANQNSHLFLHTRPHVIDMFLLWGGAWKLFHFAFSKKLNGYASLTRVPEVF